MAGNNDSYLLGKKIPPSPFIMLEISLSVSAYFEEHEKSSETFIMKVSISEISKPHSFLGVFYTKRKGHITAMILSFSFVRSIQTEGNLPKFTFVCSAKYADR